MRFLILSLILIFSNFSGYWANKVTVLVDYTMTKGRIDGLKKIYPKIFNEKRQVDIVYLSSGIKMLTSNKYEVFKPSCKFDERTELIRFVDNNNYDFKCVVNLPNSCLEVQQDYAIASIDNLPKDGKKDLKRSSNILLIDLKGVITIETPLIELYANNSIVDVGQEVEFRAKISNIKSVSDSRFEWIINGENTKIEQITNETKNFTFRTDLQSNSLVKCQLVINGCTYESSALEISVNECEFSVPYLLDFNAPLAFSMKEKYPNRHYIAPLNNSDQSKIILIKQKCFFNEFELEVSNMAGIILKTEPYKIDEEKTREILQFLSIKDNKIKAIDIKATIEYFPAQELFIKVIPKNLNIPYNNLPKYEVFFKDCQ